MHKFDGYNNLKMERKIMIKFGIYVNYFTSTSEKTSTFYKRSTMWTFQETNPYSSSMRKMDTREKQYHRAFTEQIALSSN